MAEPSKFENGLESFANTLNDSQKSAHLPRSYFNENSVLELLHEAVTDFGVQGIYYRSESLLTFLEHEPVEAFISPKTLKEDLEQKHKLITPQLRESQKSIIYVKSVAELGRPNAANEEDRSQKGGFVTCLFHGENGRRSLIMFGLADSCPDLNEESLLTLQHYGQITYLKINELIAKRERVIRLTPRESEMVKYIAKGRSNPEIAEITGLSVHTVNGYLRGIYLKTSTKDRVSLSLFALHKGLLL